MTENNRPTSEVLNLAADLIEERGWTSATGWCLEPTEAESPLCLEGGIIAAAGLAIKPDETGSLTDREFEPLFACPAYLAVCTHLGIIDGGPNGVWSWNDQRDRTATEVIEVLRATAVIEQARESTARTADAARPTGVEVVA